jgi:hypothetical protein
MPFIKIVQYLKPKKYTFSLTQYLHNSYFQNILRMQEFGCNYLKFSWGACLENTLATNTGLGIFLQG